MKKTHTKSAKAIAALLAASLLATAQVGTVFAEENTEAPGVEADASIDAQEAWGQANAFYPFQGAKYMLTYVTDGNNARITGYDIPALVNHIGGRPWTGADINSDWFIQYIDGATEPNPLGGFQNYYQAKYLTLDADEILAINGNVAMGGSTVADETIYEYNGDLVYFVDPAGTSALAGNSPAGTGAPSAVNNLVAVKYDADVTAPTYLPTWVFSADVGCTGHLLLFADTGVVDVDRDYVNYVVTTDNNGDAVTEVGHVARPVVIDRVTRATGATIPGTANPVAVGAFSGNPGFELQVPSTFYSKDTKATYTVTEIGNKAFSIINAAQSAIGQPLIDTWWFIGTLSIPGTVSKIGQEAYYNCKNLTPDTITLSNMRVNMNGTLTDNAPGTVTVNGVTIPGSVTSIGTKAFYGCRGLITPPGLYVGTGWTPLDNLGWFTHLFYHVVPTSLTIGQDAFGMDALEASDYTWIIADKDATWTATAAEGQVKASQYAANRGYLFVFTNSFFTDIAVGDWKYQPAQFCITNGFMTADQVLQDDGSLLWAFDPETPVTRAEVALSIYALAKNANRNTDPPIGPRVGRVFSDVNEAHLQTAVNYMYSWRICDGKDGRFGSADPITREELATMLFNFCALADVRWAQADQLTDDWESTLVRFADVDDVSYWAEPGLAWAVYKGVITGKGPVIGYADSTTRGEYAAMVRTLYNVR